MNRIDRLLKKAKPKPSLVDRLKQNNPYMGKSCDELLDYMSEKNYRAPEKGTKEWNQFIFALTQSYSTYNVGKSTE